MPSLAITCGSIVDSFVMVCQWTSSNEIMMCYFVAVFQKYFSLNFKKLHAALTTF